MTICTIEDARDFIEQQGLAPFFENACPGYGLSIEEHADPAVWFSGVEGPWEWKGPLIRATGAAYGKLFRTKAGFVTREWFGDLVNLRGGLIPFQERWEEGGATEAMRVLYELLADEGPQLTRELRRRGGFGTRKEKGRSGFDGALCRLQMLGYVTTLDIEYDLDGAGEPYGWGQARMALVEQALPEDLEKLVDGRSAAQSRERILTHLERVCPSVPSGVLGRLIDMGTSTVPHAGGGRKARGKRWWIVPANPRYFDLDGHLEHEHTLTWKQSSRVEVGDEVLMYVTAPAREVRWHLRVTDVDLPATGTYEMRVDRLMRLELVGRADPPAGAAELEREGISHVRGPRTVDADTFSRLARMDGA